MENDRQSQRLSWRTLVAYGAGGMMGSFVVGNTVVLLNPFYNGILGVPATLVGALIFLPRLWDAVSDPLIGQLSDNCRSRWGRRRPFIFLGAVGAGIAYILFWLPPFAAGNTMGNASWLLVVGLTLYTCSTLFLIPYHALGYELSLDYDQRTRLMSVMMVIGQVSEAFRLYALPLGLLLLSRTQFADSQRHAFGVSGLLFGAVVILSGVTVAVCVKERFGQRAAAELSLWKSITTTLNDRLYLRLIGFQLLYIMGVYFVATTLFYLQTFYMDAPMVAGNSNLISALMVSIWIAVWNRLTPHIGKVWALRIGAVCIAAAALVIPLAFVAGHVWRATIVFPFFWAPGWAACIVMIPAITADLTDLDELKTGKRREGSYASVVGFITKLAATGVAIPVGLVLDYVVKFDTALGPNQAEETWQRMKLCTMVIPCILLGLAFVMLLRFPLTKRRMQEVRALLDNRA